MCFLRHRRFVIKNNKTQILILTLADSLCYIIFKLHRAWCGLFSIQVDEVYFFSNFLVKGLWNYTKQHHNLFSIIRIHISLPYAKLLHIKKLVWYASNNMLLYRGIIALGCTVVLYTSIYTDTEQTKWTLIIKATHHFPFYSLL